ncbi:MAG: FAD-binding oxidoreductase [Clostridiales bacterium]|nr:FAD-binding oxidoreductase [Clostridiales bacterium]
MKTDRLIIGAGLYGLYAALYCAKQGYSVVVIECENAPFKRATYINQARVHQGYHYPRSISTALKSAGYFERFNADYSFCINREFEQIYATSSHFSWTDGQRFKEFCRAAGIPCEELYPGNYFKEGLCDGAFMTREYTYDAVILRDYFLSELNKYSKSVELKLGEMITGISRDADEFVVRTRSGLEYKSGFVLNATYASTNQISEMAGFEKFKIKYELCEIILCDVNEKMKNIGFTVMDGPFFSIMPFGKTGLHSLTSVTFTPHTTSYDAVPNFQCQKNKGGLCSGKHLANCNECSARPQTAFPYMRSLAEKYLLEDYKFEYKESLFSIKPILLSSEIDDSRPTVIRKCSDKPVFISVLSGKINTVYDLNEVLDNG